MEWSRRLFGMAAVLFGFLVEKISRIQENGRRKTGICVGAVALGQALGACGGSGSSDRAVHDVDARMIAFAGKGRNRRDVCATRGNRKEFLKYRGYAEVPKLFRKKGEYKARDCPELPG